MLSKNTGFYRKSTKKDKKKQKKSLQPTEIRHIAKMGVKKHGFIQNNGYQYTSCEHERLMSYVNRREYLSKRKPHPCDKCGDTMQQQLIDYMFTENAKWKCRICKHIYQYEPPRFSQAES